MINGFGKTEADPMTVRRVVEMSRTPLFQKFQRIGRLACAFRLHEINGSHGGCKLRIELTSCLLDRLLSQRFYLGIQDSLIATGRDLFQIRKHATANEIDFETENGILIGSRSGQRIDLLRNTEQLRQELADVARH